MELRGNYSYQCEDVPVPPGCGSKMTFNILTAIKIVCKSLYHNKYKIPFTNDNMCHLRMYYLVDKLSSTFNGYVEFKRSERGGHR